jgi:hypothetical protein
MRKLIKTSELSINDIPSAVADWDEISTFALTFDPFLELGTTDIYKMDFINFDESSSVPQLRTSLFLWQRSWNNRSRNIYDEGLENLKKILVLMKQTLSDSQKK